MGHKLPIRPQLDWPRARHMMRMMRASDPQYEIHSDKSDHLAIQTGAIHTGAMHTGAIHTGSALKRENN